MELLCSLTYVKIDNIMDMQLGWVRTHTPLLSVFMLVPVHPADQQLLGIRWEDNLYIDAILPFGLRSAPNALADALEWIIR